MTIEQIEARIKRNEKAISEYRGGIRNAINILPSLGGAATDRLEEQIRFFENKVAEYEQDNVELREKLQEMKNVR